MIGPERILPVVSRKVIDQVTNSLDDADMESMEREFNDGSPLSIWLGSMGLEFFMGGYYMKRLLRAAASEQKMILSDPSLDTIGSYIHTLAQRRQELADRIGGTTPPRSSIDLEQTMQAIQRGLQSGDITDSSISRYKGENSVLMDFVAVNWVRQLARNGYHPAEIASIQIDSMQTYELYREEASRK